MEAHGNGIESSAEIELRGLSIYTHHGVTEAEQEVGQRLEFDISFDVPDCDAVLTDRLEDTVDYAQVCDIVALAATERSYRTLERLAQVVGERLMERYGCESVRVRAAKPEPPLPLAIQEVAVEVTQERAVDEDEPRTSPWPRAADRLPRPRLQRRRPRRPPAGGGRAARAEGIEVEAVSSTYVTEPVGEILDQPDFLNAAVRIRTDLEPEELLDACKRVEAERGRTFDAPRHSPAPARRRPAPARRPRAQHRPPHPAAPARSPPAASSSCRCWSSTPSWRCPTGRASPRRLRRCPRLSSM